MAGGDLDEEPGNSGKDADSPSDPTVRSASAVAKWLLPLGSCAPNSLFEIN